MPLAIAFAILILGPWLFGRATAALRLPAILGMLLFGLCRSIGVLLSVGPDRSLGWRERLFAVQAALGAVPLAAGVPGGAEILSVAVLSIFGRRLIQSTTPD